MTLSNFELLVREALSSIPAVIQDRLNNVDVVVEDWPTKAQLVGSKIDEDTYLLGLYEGIPLTGRYGYDMVLPDKITLFQTAIEAVCSNQEETVKEIRDTIVHEIAHHFGIEDDRIHDIGL